ncbi:hypothetical protein RE432_14990 [Pusillimonas sp. SM2304]|uniref:hypothetical protein n=1 Tax=Pusillimonas sp. SM2304 TaxID=3073241 RepID=UPI00287504F8|nr:hypothetical protein [Pusillimonas sp. SM2304]MDS1141745.1 hypothetical protein [Pusillimonas sp. SM2304]
MTYGTTSSATTEPVRFKREMTRMPMRPPYRCPITKEYRFDGQGGFEPNSGKIPLGAIPCAVVVVALLGAMLCIGAGVF